MSKFYVLILFLFNAISFSFGQRNVRDSIIPSPWVSVHYGINGTGGDLAKRHGTLHHVGFFGGFKSSRNWIYGLDAAFMFGNDIRVNGLFDHLVDSKGNITDQNGDIAIVIVASRGIYANGTIGKILPILSPNPNSGVYVNVGAGFLAHKIRIETQDHVVPQLELDYRKGYDKLTSGLNTSQFIGYSFMANKGFANFYGGFYAQQGYTFNRRTVFFESPEIEVSKDMMLDLQFGAKFAWIVPIYKRQPKDFYFD